FAISRYCVSPARQSSAKPSVRTSRWRLPARLAARSKGVERGGQVGEQVAKVFDADRDPHQRIAHVEALPFLVRHLRVRRAGGVTGQALHAAETHRVASDPQAPQKVEGGPLAPDQLERKDGPGEPHLRV